jgi:hypothetical protein
MRVVARFQLAEAKFIFLQGHGFRRELFTMLRSNTYSYATY